LIEINWKGKIGYGDIVSPLCYSYVIAQKNNSDVTLNIYWKHKVGEYYKPEDNETLDERFRYLYSIIQPIKQNVIINEYFGKFLTYNHSNYDPDLPYHNYWYSHIKNNPTDYVVMNTTEKNQQALIDFDKRKIWKDPIGVEEFKKLEEHISKKYKVVHVDYSTPIEDVINLYKNCYCAVGYHGSTMWLARYLKCPMIIFSNKIKLTQFSFPWAIVKNNTKNFDIDKYQNRSIKLLEDIDSIHAIYIETPNLYRLRQQRT